MPDSVSWSPDDDLPHADAVVDEWVFAAWLDDGSMGLVSGHRLVRLTARPIAWYWFAFVERHGPLLHLTEWEVGLRSDPFIVKAPEMWAEHHCDAPLEQWSIGNEGHAAALDDPDEALGRAYGVPTPMATDVEWYAVGSPMPIGGGFAQRGVAHGVIELADRPHPEFVEAPAHRWRRWSLAGDLGPVGIDRVVAHTGLRAPFAFPDGSVTDWVLTPDGWRSRL